MTGGQKDTGGIGLPHPIHLSLLKKVFKRPRTDYQRHEHPNDVIRSSSPIRVQLDNKQRSSYCSREINSPARSNTEHDISINVRPQDNDFENSSEHRDLVQDPAGMILNQPRTKKEYVSFSSLKKSSSFFHLIDFQGNLRW